MLYSEEDRNSNDKVSGLIRNAFSDKEYSVLELDEYKYYLNLKDMIDFGAVSFSKAIKTTKTRVLKTTSGLINYKLSNNQLFDVSIGNRVVSDEIEEDGIIPIYSANVFEEFGRINKQNLTDFSMPSIIWGIDGDWMVNLLPAGMPFYPTDHCGVLRIKTDEIIPKYMAVALETEGKFEKFSRSNRASTQRIKALTIQIPKDKSVQQKIVDEVVAIEKEIISNNLAIANLEHLIENEYARLFINSDIDDIEIGLVAPFETRKVDMASFAIEDYITTDNMLQQKRGIIPYNESAEKITNVTMYSKGDILISNIRPYLKKIWLSDKSAGCSPDVLVFHISDTSKMLPEYVFYSLYQDSFFEYVMEGKIGLKMPRGDKKQIPHYKIKNADITIQKIFVDFVKKTNTEKEQLHLKNEDLYNQKKNIINKHFA